jgi:hypothetical protein
VYATGAIDPKRQLLITMGHEYQSTAPHVYAIDLTGANGYASVEWTSQVTGCDGLASAPYPGFVYDPALDRIVGYPNQGDTVYIFNPDTKSCTTQTFPNGPQNTPGSNTQGTFGRFNYFPALDAFVMVNAFDDNVYVLRIGASGSPVAQVKASPIAQLKPSPDQSKGVAAAYAAGSSAINGVIDSLSGAVNTSQSALAGGSGGLAGVSLSHRLVQHNRSGDDLRHTGQQGVYWTVIAVVLTGFRRRQSRG